MTNHDLSSWLASTDASNEAMRRGIGALYPELSALERRFLREVVRQATD